MQLLLPQVIRNMTALYGVHLITYALPLLTTPFLARTLGPAAWGMLAVAQAFALLLSLLIEYGFELSGTREAARVRDDRAALGTLLSGVVSAKMVLTLAAALLALGAQLAVPAFRAHPALLWITFGWAAAQALNVMWFFQGLEDLPRVSGIDIALKAVGTGLIFVVVGGPDDAWRVPAVQGGAAFASAVVCLRLATHRAPLAWAGAPVVAQTLRLGASMFIFRAASSVYATTSVFLLGLFVGPQLVGYYTGAERIARAFQGLLTPMHRSLFPRYSRLGSAPLPEARAALRAGMRLMLGAGAALTAVSVLGAPLLVQILLGPGYGPAIPLLQVLGLLPAIIAVNMVLGLFWLLPRGKDTTFNLTILGAAALNAGLVVWLVPRGGPLAMAGAVVATEVAVMLALSAAYHFTQRNAPPALKRA